MLNGAHKSVVWIGEWIERQVKDPGAFLRVVVLMAMILALVLAVGVVAIVVFG